MDFLVKTDIDKSVIRTEQKCTPLYSLVFSRVEIKVIFIQIKALFFFQAFERLSLAKIIHPPDRCDISRCWLNGTISPQVCLDCSLKDVQLYLTTQCHRCCTFRGSVQLSCWRRECPQELFPIYLAFVSQPYAASHVNTSNWPHTERMQPQQPMTSALGFSTCMDIWARLPRQEMQQLICKTRGSLRRDCQRVCVVWAGIMYNKHRCLLLFMWQSECTQIDETRSWGLLSSRSSTSITLSCSVTIGGTMLRESEKHHGACVLTRQVRHWACWDALDRCSQQHVLLPANIQKYQPLRRSGWTLHQPNAVVFLFFF